MFNKSRKATGIATQWLLSIEMYHKIRSFAKPTSGGNEFAPQLTPEIIAQALQNVQGLTTGAKIGQKTKVADVIMWCCDAQLGWFAMMHNRDVHVGITITVLTKTSL